MKTLYRCLSALMLLMSLSAAQAANMVVSTLKDMSGTQCLTYDNNTPLTMKDCDGAPHQNFNFLSPYGWIYQSLGSSSAPYVKGSFPPATTVSMGTTGGAGLNGVWWRPAGSNKIHMAGGTRQCLTRSATGVEMQDCIADTDHNNEDWLLDSVVAPDWPYTGLIYLQNDATNGCIQAPGAQFGAFKTGTPLTLGNCEDQYPNEYFEFTNSGTIKMLGKCLTAGSESGDSVTYEDCDGSVSQRFNRAGSYLVSPNPSGTLCLGVANNSMKLGASLQVQTCVSAPDPGLYFQHWDLSKLPNHWPPAGGSVPSTEVTGATLTNKQLESVVGWIQAETSIDTTPFCYKPAAYDRDIGIAPAKCGTGQQSVTGLCYDNCRSGYHRANPPTATCWADKTSVKPNGKRCTAKDMFGTCWSWALNCPKGYKSDGLATCWLPVLDWTYDPLPVAAGDCLSNRVKNAVDGLCYVKPRAGYTCDVTYCKAVCPSGTRECGVAACANSQSSCGASITDMVVSSGQLLAFIATGGTMAAEGAIVKASLTAVKAAKTANDLYQAEEVLRKSIGDFMDAAENDLASISTDKVAADVDNEYHKGSANYRYIAREWASRMLAYSILELQQNVDNFLISAIDPSGAYAVYNAFAKPTCTRHTTIPQY